MLLKCRYLSQFSVNEVAKNATNMYKAMEMCPFMAHARRTLVTTTSSVADIETKPTMMTNDLPRQHQQDQQVPIESTGRFLVFCLKSRLWNDAYNLFILNLYLQRSTWARWNARTRLIVRSSRKATWSCRSSSRGKSSTRINRMSSHRRRRRP